MFNEVRRVVEAIGYRRRQSRIGAPQPLKNKAKNCGKGQRFARQ